MRISKDEYYLDIAQVVLKRSTCIRRNYGVVIVKDDEAISTGYNGAARGEHNCCDSGNCVREKLNIPSGENYELCVAIHAEDNAITSAGINCCDESEANPQPCIMCRRKIINAGIARVVGRVNGKPKDLVLT